MKDLICRVTVLLGSVAFLVFWIVDPACSSDEAACFLIKSTVIHLLGSIVFFALLIYQGFRVFNRPSRSSLLLVFLPALLVVVNNFPILGLLWGEARIVRWDLMWLFVLDSMLIGVFEELAFRGTLFLMILEKKRHSGREIFFTSLISSLVFGLVHFANLLEGAGIVATLLQVGYSFLIGGMCAIVLLKTGNLLFSVLLHGIFDVGGRMIERIGEGFIWNTPTVVITAVLGVAVLIHMLVVLFRIKPCEAEIFYAVKSEEPES